jgi:hypothetical protein
MTKCYAGEMRAARLMFIRAEGEIIESQSHPQGGSID